MLDFFSNTARKERRKDAGLNERNQKEAGKKEGRKEGERRRERTAIQKYKAVHVHSKPRNYISDEQGPCLSADTGS